MKSLASVSAVTLTLGALCTVLGLIIAYELAFPLEPMEGDAATTDLPWEAPAVESDFTLPPLSQFQEVITRPLFLKTRRPAPVANAVTATQAAPNAELSKYVVTGIVITSEQRFALIRGINDNTVQRVADGQQFHGWSVRAIENEAVVFTRESEEERLPLLRKTPEKFKLAAQRAALLARRQPAARPPAKPVSAGQPGQAVPPENPRETEAEH
ncbi:MAG: hypothetical protein ACREVH_02745 [Gammaproteobacteria bacterium]